MKFSKILLVTALALVIILSVVSCDLVETFVSVDSNTSENNSDNSSDQTNDNNSVSSDPSADKNEESGSSESTDVHTVCEDVTPKDAKCDVCGKSVPCVSCVDESPKNAKCDVCGKSVPCVTCVDASPKDAKCDVCGKSVPCVTCVDESPKNAKCDVCGKSVPCVTCVDASPKNGRCDVCGKKVKCAVCVDEKNGIKDAKCDICGSTIKYAPIDNQFEESAKQYLANYQGALGITQSASALVSYTYEGVEIPMRTENLIVQNRDENGNIYQLLGTDVYVIYGNSEMVTSSSETIVFQIGNLFYVTSSQMAEMGEDPITFNYLVTATEDEIANLEGQLTQNVNPELAYSVNHFRAVNISTDENGNTVYVCYGLRAESAEAYEQLCQNMANTAAGMNVNYSIDQNSFVYTVKVDESGRIVEAELKMTFSAEIPELGQTLTYEMTSAQTYSYEVEAVEAPEVTNRWVGMTLTEYFGLAHPENACTSSHTDDNANGLCDLCGAIVGTVPHLGECSDGEDAYDGYCDVCQKPLAQ